MVSWPACLVRFLEEVQEEVSEEADPPEWFVALAKNGGLSGPKGDLHRPVPDGRSGQGFGWCWTGSPGVCVVFRLQGGDGATVAAEMFLVCVC